MQLLKYLQKAMI